MKASKVCPKCDGRKFFHIPSMQITYCDATTVIRTLEMFAAEVPNGEKGLLGGEKTDVVKAGPYESVVCATCGYAELYASESALENLARISNKTSAVRVIENEAPRATPFR